LEPVGEYRRDYRIASLCSLVYNVASSFGSGKSGKRKISKPHDFMAFLDIKPVEEVEEQTVGQMKTFVSALATAFSEKKELVEKGKYPKPPNWYKRNRKPLPETYAGLEDK